MPEHDLAGIPLKSGQDRRLWEAAGLSCSEDASAETGSSQRARDSG